MFHVEPKQQQTTLARTKDFLVSGECFDVVLNQATQIARTHPQPAKEKLQHYYASEEYISHGNQRKTALDYIYAFVQQLMLGQKQRWIKQEKKGTTYLDIGCGTGALVHYLANYNWEVYGVEPSKKARSFSAIPERIYSSLEELPIKQVDVIALWHVLEHLPQPEEAIKEYFDRLDADGRLFLALPNFNSFDASYYAHHWAAYDVPRHLWHFSASGIIELCKKNGFDFIRSKPLLFDAFYVSYLSEQHRGSKFPFIKGICVGLWSNLKALFTQEYSSKLYIFKKHA
ncbi:MAG: class I SAM-dependent methyltransferase [Flavobacteriaceae bacterium]